MKQEKQTVGEDDRGLRCLTCGCRHFYVIYTRRAAGRKLLLRRECRHCGRRATTCERIVG